MRYINNNKHKKGFTLIEMIIVLLLIVLLMAWGIPNYQNLKANRMVSDFANEMVYSFTNARAEAIRNGTTVEIRPNGSWDGGWSTVVVNADGSEQEVAVQDPILNLLDMTGIDARANENIVFDSIGGLSMGVVRQFVIVNTVTGAQRRIDISLSGSAKAIKL